MSLTEVDAINQIKLIINKIESNKITSSYNVHTPVFRVLINIIILLLFATLYYLFFTVEDWLPTEDDKQANYSPHWFSDSLFFALMVQGTLGFANRYPNSHIAKMLVMLHVFSVITVNIMI